MDGASKRMGFEGGLGLEWDEVSGERARAHVDVQAHHLQPYGVVHGGVYCAIAESLASAGARAAAATLGDGKAAVGVENHTSFLRAVGPGRRVEAEAVARHSGRRVQLWTVSIRDGGDGRELAISTVRLLLVEPPRD